LNPDNSAEWTCLYCKKQCCTSRTHYYANHYEGQCLGQQSLDSNRPEEDLHEEEEEDPEAAFYVDDNGQQHSGAAADLARQHDVAVAQFQQRCIEAGLTHEQLLALQPGLQHLGDPFRQLLEQLEAETEEADAEPDAEVEAELKEQTEALQQRLVGKFCTGESPASALEAWVRILDWRCRHHIKVIDWHPVPSPLQF
jgi:hypothetical protein